MLGRLCVGVLSGLLVFGVLAAAMSRGLTQAVDVVVLVDKSAAEYGETIVVTVHVFDRGVWAEPSEVSAVIDKLPGITALSLVRQSTGVFRGEFVFNSHPSLVTVNATVGSVRDSGAAVVWHRFNEVRIVPSASTARPGRTITLAVEARDRDGRFQDADRVSLTADVIYAPDFGRRSPPTALVPIRTGIGRYSAAYAIPTDIERDALVEFRADVVSPSGGTGVGANVYVDIPDAFLVWYRTVAIVGPNATVEIDVASLTGAPVPNATVSLRTWPFVGSVVLDREGTTDPWGAVRFELHLPMIGLGFHGNVTSGSLRQPYSGVITFPPSVDPAEPQIMRENPDEFFGVGETAVLRFRLARGANPIPDQELFAYAQTASDLVLAERVQTDATGAFEVRFVVPSGFVRIGVAGFVDGTWRTFQPDFSAMNRLAAAVSSPDGWHLRITGRFPATGEPWTAHLSLAARGEAFPGPWVASGSFGGPRIVGGIGGEPFAFDVALPRFLPAGQQVSLSIGAESFRGDYHRFLLTIVTGNPIVPSTDLSVLVPILGLGVVIALSTVGFRKRRPSQPGG